MASDQMIAVFAAVELGDAKKVDQLLARLEGNFTYLTNQSDYRMRTPLHLAVEYGHVDVVDVLIGHNIDLSAKDCGGFTALHLAAELGHEKIVARLLEKSPKLAKMKGRKGLTCLHLAAIRGRAVIVKQLLTMDMELINETEGNSALTFAVEHGHEEVVSVLVESVTAAQDDTYAKAMFLHAIIDGFDRVVSQLFIQSPHLINVKDGGESALQLAAECEHHTIAIWLLSQRPQLTEVGGTYKMTLLHFAAEYGYDTVVAQLIVEKPHLLDVAGDALYLAAQGGHEKVVAQLLAANPALATQTTSLGCTALHVAVENGHDMVVAQLVARCPELIDAEDREGNTALSLALTARSISVTAADNIMAFLLANGATKVTAEVFWVVLKTATNFLCNENVKMMLDRKPELIRSKDEKRSTVLHYVFGRLGRGSLFSEQLMTQAWRMNPKALHEINTNVDTPFHAAVRSNNEFALELVQSKLSFDQIMDAFAKCKKAYPRTLVSKLIEPLYLPLLSFLNKDVVGLIFDYCCIIPNEPNYKRRREGRKW